MNTPEDLEFCTRQILRLAMMYNFPGKSQPAIEDLAAALMTALDRETAHLVIDYFKKSATAETRCPMESEITAQIQAHVTATQGEWLPDPDCTRGCNGSGYLYDETRTPARFKGDCSCWARRQPPDYSKMKRRPFDVSGGVQKVRVQ